MERTDFRNRPAYTVPEAARYLSVPVATLRSWVTQRVPADVGLHHPDPIIALPQESPPMLSFWNIVEAHVLRSLRTEHGVSMDKLRQAVSYAEQALNVSRLLLSQELCTEAGSLFIERYGEIIDISSSGQIAMRSMFREHLARVEWDEWKFPARLFPPFTAGVFRTGARAVSIAADVAFGRPVLARGGISTAVIAARIDAGERLDDLAADYDLTPDDIEDAVLYERAA